MKKILYLTDLNYMAKAHPKSFAKINWQNNYNRNALPGL